MPYNNTRSTNSQNNLAYNAIENPVFKIKLRGLDNEYEQPNTSEKGVDSANPKKFKIGNGTLTWSELPYHNPSVTISDIQGLQEILDNKVTVPTQAEWDNFRLTLQGQDYA